MKELIVPHVAKQVVSLTHAAWMHEMDYHQFGAVSCWCGCTPGSCNDCKESDSLDPHVSVGKINISSGEDASWSRM